jgi:hypothetical protein
MYINNENNSFEYQKSHPTVYFQILSTFTSWKALIKLFIPADDVPLKKSECFSMVISKTQR